MRWPKDSSEEWLRGINDSEMYGFATSAIAHSIVLVLIFSVPRGLQERALEPISQPPDHYVTISTAIDVVEPVSTLGMGVLDGEAGKSASSLRTRAPQAQKKRSFENILGTEVQPVQDGGAGGSGKLFAMYCVGCDDCLANPSHPACWTGALEIRNEEKGYENDWIQVVHHALTECSPSANPGVALFLRSDAGWHSDQQAEFMNCVVAKLEQSSRLFPPKSVQVWVGSDVEYEVNW